VLYVLRQLLSVVILPFVVTVVIPIWIARGEQTTLSLGATPLQLIAQVVGVASLALGFWLFGYSLLHFATRGRGTLAPWDPPRTLVVTGPYRYVRNPMISGVVFILFAESLLLLSPAHAWWAVGFLATNFVLIPLMEEPQLEARFGESYREYKRHVGRLIPRLRPWNASTRPEA
jgi:protein-S-isoprenylcysteine O-methyltransferase Ste14